MKILKIIVLLGSVCLLYADQVSEMYFHRGIDKYLGGDVDGAISDTEQSLSLDGADKKAVAFYVKLLLERGAKLLENRQFKDALSYYEKAVKYDSENREINEIISMIRKRIGGDGEFTAVSELTGEGRKVSSSGFSELIKTLQVNQDKLIEKLVKPGEKIDQLVEKTDEERRELLKMLTRKDELVISAMNSQNASMRSVVYLIIAAIILAIVAYLFVARSSTRRDTVLIKQQETILNLMVQQQQALAQGNATLRLSEGTASNNDFVTPREMLNDPKPRIRARGIEIIDARLVQENEDPEIAGRILKPFIEDRDNRVRANAIKTLFKYKPEDALAAAKDMLVSEDKWMRVSGAWVLGEMSGYDPAAETLITFMDSTEYYLKRRAIKSLSKLSDTENKKRLDPEMEAKVKKILEQTAKGEDWVM